jgi:hypothetical protein
MPAASPWATVPMPPWEISAAARGISPAHFHEVKPLPFDGRTEVGIGDDHRLVAALPQAAAQCKSGYTSPALPTVANKMVKDINNMLL